jgi:acetoin utilization deacetylase AcuC-like enzyme
VRIVYTDRYTIDLGSHIFPIDKYARVRRALLERGLAAPGDLVAPEPASWEDVALVHTPDYVEKVRTGRLTVEEQAELELPWSLQVVEGFRAMAGGTILAGQLAVGGTPWTIVVHLGGGFHHAFCNRGEGFCVFNDVAIAVRRLKRDKAIRTAAIVDCDVHHGNGTAAIFTGERSVFTYSMHQVHNYPAFKPCGTLDVGLGDAAADEEYLDALARSLPKVIGWRPDIVFYLAGADPYIGDQLGGLNVTKDGLRQRDRMVFAAAREAGLPVVVTLAGGYARKVQDTVDIHVATVEEARAALE